MNILIQCIHTKWDQIHDRIKIRKILNKKINLNLFILKIYNILHINYIIYCIIKKLYNKISNKNIYFCNRNIKVKNYIIMQILI